MKELHPIQLLSISVSKLSIVVHDLKAAADYEGGVQVEMMRGLSDVSPHDPNIAVGFKVAVRPDSLDGGNAPFEMEVELSGQFMVDYDRFNCEDIPRWAEVNSAVIMMPFIREQIYGLALRAGVKGMMIPLIVSKPAKKNDS